MQLWLIDAALAQIGALSMLTGELYRLQCDLKTTVRAARTVEVAECVRVPEQPARRCHSLRALQLLDGIL